MSAIGRTKIEGAHSLLQAAGLTPNRQHFSRVEMAISQRSSLAASSRLDGIIGNSLALALKKLVSSRREAPN